MRESPSGIALNAKELSVLELLAQGYTADEIAEMLSVPRTTVVSRLGTLYEKLGARNAPHAVYLAVGEGILV